jgi:hypothetical protein
MDTSPDHAPDYKDVMMSPEHVHDAPFEETVMESPRQPTPWEEENSMLECAMMMTRICERQRMDHFTGPTSNPNAYIFCCAYTAPTMMVSVMFLEHFGITSTENLNYRLTHQQLLGPDKQTLLTMESVCSGINEVMGNMWTHHSNYQVGIDVWLSSDMSSRLFETSLDPGVNMVSFVDDALNLTVHHAFIYVSKVDQARCYIVDSWCSTDIMHMRNLIMRQLPTAEVVAALSTINTGLVDDPSEIMMRVFLDPVPGGSCRDKLRVVKLKKTVVQGLINTQFSMGFKGDSKFGGKRKAPTSKAALRKRKASTSKASTSKAALRKRKASTSKAALRKRKASTSKASTSKASSRRKNKSRRLR